MRSLKLYEQLLRAIVQDTEGLDTDHNCTRCKLGEQPKLRTRCVAPEGEGGGLLVVGESPGREEDACLVPETLVLMADLSWKRLGEIAIGDKILAPDEEPERQGFGSGVSGSGMRRWHVAEVTNKVHRRADCWEVKTETGVLVGSGDHRVLAHKGVGLRWRRLDALQAGTARMGKIASIGEPWVQDLSYESGWLSGFFDGEGHVAGSNTDRTTTYISGRKKKSPGTVGYSQNLGPVDDRAQVFIRALGFTLLSAEKSSTTNSKGVDVVCIRRGIAGGQFEAMRFLGTVRPVRLLLSYPRVVEGLCLRGIHWSSVTSRKEVGQREVIDISTTTGTFIANGFVVHNCGRPFIGVSGKLLRAAIDKHWTGPIAIANAIGCSPGADIDKSKLEKPVEACRPYLAQTIREVAPKRIVAVGAWAAFSIFGRTVPMFTMRRSYAYVYDDDRSKAVAIPVMFVLHPAAALRNRFIKSWFDRDIEWALTATPPEPPINAIAHLVDNEQDALEAVRELERAPRTSFDIEAAGIMFDPSYRVLCCSCSPLAEDGSPTDTVFTWTKEGLADLKARVVLAKWLSSAKKIKAGHNLKYDSNGVRSGLGIVLRGIGVDTRLARKLLEPESDGSLDKCSELVGMGGFKEESIAANHGALAPLKQSLGAEKRVAKYDAWAANPIGKAPPKPSKTTRSATQYIQDLAYRDPLLVDVIRADPSESGRYMFALLPNDILYRRNALDTIATARLDHLLTGELKKEPQLQRTWDRIVMPASRAVEHVERWGVAVDKTAIQNFDAYLVMKQSFVRARFDAYGKDFNPDSPQQVSELLFTKLGLPSIKQTPAEEESTDKSVLDALSGKHPIVDDLIEWRHLATLKKSYAGGMISYIRPDGRIHASILLDGARSGRTSIQNPALQTIPRAKDSPEGKMIRDCFIAPEGTLLVEADYSQAELRSAALLSGDEVMADIFRQGVDFHRRTAELISKTAWGLDPSKIEDKHRTQAKSINFALVFGMGDKELARRTGTTVTQAARIREAILGKFSKLAKWIDIQLAYARKHGTIWTWWDGQLARRRPMWQIADQDDARRVVAEHGSANTPIQGTASEFLIASLIEVVEWITGDGIEADVKLCLPVHDSLVLEVRKNMVDEVAAQLRSVMLGHNSLNVPFEIDLKVGPSWGSMEPYKLPA